MLKGKNIQLLKEEEILSFCSFPGEKRKGNTPNASGVSRGFFGVSALSSSLPASALVEVCDQEGFSGIELSAAQIENLSISQRNRVMEYFPRIVTGSFVNSSVMEGLLQSSSKMLNGFVQELSDLFEKLSRMQIKYLSFDLPFLEILRENDACKMENLHHLLKKLLPSLTRNDQILLLPFPVPSPDPEMDWQKVNSFLRKSMTPLIKLRLDVYPHELTRKSDLFALCGLLGFDTKEVVLHYNADRGETLVKEHVLLLIRYLLSYGFQGSFLISPLSRDGRFMMPEAAHFAEILKEIRKKPESEFVAGNKTKEVL